MDDNYYVMKVEQQQKMDPRWEKILEKRRLRLAILDSGATSGAAVEEDKYVLIDTGQKSNKTFMFPNNAKQKATKKMHLQHKIRQEAKEMNIIPGLHAPLISVPKLADTGYITVFEKNIANVYNKSTTTVTASKRPVLQAPRCQTSGLWTMGIDPSKRTGETEADATPESINALFDLPSTKQTALWYHAAAEWPEKETFLAAIRKGNYAMWPGLTVKMMSRHYPESIETKKGHMKVARQGIGSTKPKAITTDDGTRIKIEGEAITPAETPHTKENNVHFQEMEMSETIHSNNTGPFPHTLQWGNKIVMVAVHLDANYIFAEPMRNKTDGKRIEVYQKIIKRMRRSKLGLKNKRTRQRNIEGVQRENREKQYDT